MVLLRTGEVRGLQLRLRVLAAAAVRADPWRGRRGPGVRRYLGAKLRGGRQRPFGLYQNLFVGSIAFERMHGIW